MSNSEQYMVPLKPGSRKVYGSLIFNPIEFSGNISNVLCSKHTVLCYVHFGHCVLMNLNLSEKYVLHTVTYSVDCKKINQRIELGVYLHGNCESGKM